jgi:hypothetical protein
LTGLFDPIIFLSNLYAIVLTDVPLALAIIWLVYKVRLTVRKTSALADIMPELSPEEKIALAWSIRRAIHNEVELFRKAKARGEA